VYVYDDVACSS